MSQLVFDDDEARRMESRVPHPGSGAPPPDGPRGARSAARRARSSTSAAAPASTAVELAAEVGPSARSSASTSSEAMIGLAGRRCAALGNVALRVADATALGVAGRRVRRRLLACRCSSTFPTPGPGSPSCTARSDRAAACSCGTPTGPRSSMQDDELTRRVQRRVGRAPRSPSRCRGRWRPRCATAGFEAVRAQRATRIATIAVRPRDLRRRARCRSSPPTSPGHASV